MLEREAASDSSGYYAVAAADDVLLNEMTLVHVQNNSIILTRWQEQLVAFSNVCPHAGADLVEGHLHRGRVTCPDHDYKFDIRNGRALWPEDEVCRLKRYDVVEENGLVKVKLT